MISRWTPALLRQTHLLHRLRSTVGIATARPLKTYRSSQLLDLRRLKGTMSAPTQSENLHKDPVTGEMISKS